MNSSLKRRAAASLVLLGALAAPLATAVVSQAAPQRPEAVSTTSPNRILDTRESIGGHPGKVKPGETLRLAIPQAAGATSVVLNMTATEADGPGWVKVWPCDTPEPATSSLNFTPGLIAANAVAAKLGNGSICISTYAPVHLVADLAGWFVGAGDFVGTTPNRIVDTRVTKDPLAGGVERRIQVGGTPNIPNSAALVAVNLTVDAPPAAGWVVAYPCGQPTNSSTVNFNANETVANLTLVGVSGGAICVRSYDTTDLVIDTYGYSNGTGSLKVQSPQRLLDTRDAASWPYGQAFSGSKVAVRVASTGQIPASADSALLTVTVADATDDGFVTAWPCDQPLPNASTINTSAGQLRSNLALVKLAADGTACLQVTSVHGTPLSLIVDAVGWTTGGPNRTNIPANPIAPIGAVNPSLVTSGPLGGPGCTLANAAFCDTFDAPHNGGTQTGDLDPVVWGVSRVGDFNLSGVFNGIVPSHNACAGGAATPPPADVRICNGQMVESLNDGGGVGSLNTYPKQPFNFAGRTGKVVFDVSGDSDGTHGAWPEFAITDEPVPGFRRSISVPDTPHAVNEVGFAMDGCGGTGFGVGVVFVSINGNYQELKDDSTRQCLSRGSSRAMNHVEVRVSATRIEVWATDAGATTLQMIAAENLPTLAFAQGLVWMNDVHYNARKANEPCGCGTQFDHSFVWDNLGFDGPKTYRDLGFDVPYANVRSGSSINGDAETQEGYDVGGDRGDRVFTLSGVTKGAAATAKVVLNSYLQGRATMSISINGHTPVTKSVDGLETHGFTFPASDVVNGTNTIRISLTGYGAVTNVSLIMVAAASVP